MPESRPVDALKLAQPGLPLMLKESAWPSGSEAVGRNEYALPTVTAGAGDPLMTGARLSGGRRLARRDRDVERRQRT